MNLENKVAIVTGGASGIGRAIVLRLAKEGADVVVADIDLQGANKVCNEVRTLRRKALAMEADVTRNEDANVIAQTTLQEFGEIDILINNVGGPIRKGGVTFTNFYELSEEDCDATVNLTLKSVLNCCRAVIKKMMEQRTGKIINIGSVAGMMGSAGMADYSAAKGAMIAFTKVLAKELGPYGINVNCVSPGVIDHPRSPKVGEYWKTQKQTIYLRRFGQPDDVANMAVFLATDEANYITGQNISVCGGRILGGILEREP